MKADIVFDGCRKTIAIPEEICLAGVTVLYNGSHSSELDFDFIDHRDEEIIMAEKMKVVLHYYTDPAITEIGKEFLSFKNMKYIEIKEKDYCVAISV